MRLRYLLLLVSLILLVGASNATHAQDDRFTTTQQSIYLVDANNKPWSDLSCQLRVKLDSEYTKDLGADEISVEKPLTKFSSGTWRLYNLEQDANGTFARVNWLVLKDSNDPVTYQIGLYNPATKTEIPWLRKGASRVMMRNNTKPSLGQVGANNPVWWVLKNNWPILIGALFLIAVMIYLLILRYFFAGLLHRWQWGAASAQYFTWVLSLVLLLGAVASLSYAYLGTRLETWVMLAMTGAFCVLLIIVYAVSGSKQT
jgi:hypothetical protein